MVNNTKSRVCPLLTKKLMFYSYTILTPRRVVRSCGYLCKDKVYDRLWRRLKKKLKEIEISLIGSCKVLEALFVIYSMVYNYYNNYLR